MGEIGWSFRIALPKHRIALGLHRGREAFMLRPLPPLTGDRAGEPAALAAGFSLHVGVTAEVHMHTLRRTALLNAAELVSRLNRALVT